MSSAPIGVFDSGIGGLSVLRALCAQLPGERFVYYADSAHAPYGERGDAYVIARSCDVASQLLVRHRVKALVVACNTATAAAIEPLRAQYPQLPIVGIETALKPAVLDSQTRRVGVMATRGTLSSARFRALHAVWTDHADFVCQPCDGLAEAIERSVQDAQSLQQVEALCLSYLKAMGPFGQQAGEIDTLVLGCTHYPLVSDILRRLLDAQVRMLEPGAPVARQARRLLQAQSLLSERAEGGVELRTSGHAATLAKAARRWLPASARPCATA